MAAKNKPNCTFEELVEAVRWCVNHVGHEEGTDFLTFPYKGDEKYCEIINACLSERVTVRYV